MNGVDRRSLHHRPEDSPRSSASETPVILVDMHAETTSEKAAMGFFMDGLASVVVGTHTHVPTCDHRILPKGTAYCTDIGMTGPYDSVIGVEKDIIIKRFLDAPARQVRDREGRPPLRRGGGGGRRRHRPRVRHRPDVPHRNGRPLALDRRLGSQKRPPRHELSRRLPLRRPRVPRPRRGPFASGFQSTTVRAARGAGGLAAALWRCRRRRKRARRSAREWISVSELTDRMGRHLAAAFSAVCVMGEISKVTVAANGHTYFTLKDAGATLDAILWASNRDALGRPAEAGPAGRGDRRASASSTPRAATRCMSTPSNLVGAGDLQRALRGPESAACNAEGLFAEERGSVPLPTGWSALSAS
jgi:hypothetical protein